MVDLYGTNPEEVSTVRKTSDFIDKYDLTFEENLKLFQDDLSDFIFNTAKIENSQLSYLQTKDVIDGKSIPGQDPEDIIVVNNLRLACDYIQEHIHDKVSLDLASQLNKIIVKSALIYRSSSKKSKETYGFEAQPWCLSPGIEDKVTTFIDELKELPSITDQAMSLWIYMLKTRFFESGNKRTGLLLANLLMIQHGKGMISIPANYLQDFKTQVTNYRETEDIEPLKQFIYDYCIQGK